jgi:hypothetical protein
MTPMNTQIGIPQWSQASFQVEDDGKIHFEMLEAFQKDNCLLWVIRCTNDSSFLCVTNKFNSESWWKHRIVFWGGMCYYLTNFILFALQKHKNWGSKMVRETKNAVSRTGFGKYSQSSISMGFTFMHSILSWKCLEKKPASLLNIYRYFSCHYSSSDTIYRAHILYQVLQVL